MFEVLKAYVSRIIELEYFQIHIDLDHSYLHLEKKIEIVQKFWKFAGTSIRSASRGAC